MVDQNVLIDERLEKIEKRLSRLERNASRFMPIGPKPIDREWEKERSRKTLQDAIDAMKKLDQPSEGTGQ